MRIVTEEDFYCTLYMKLVDKYDNIRKEIRIVAIETKYPEIGVRYQKISIHPESRLLATMQERENIVWLRYYKFKSEEAFKEFLRKLGL